MTRLLFFCGLALALTITTVYAANECPRAVGRIMKLIAKGEGAKARAELLEALKTADVPAFIKSTPSGDIPVILVNKETAPKIQKFLDESVGTQIALQPDWNNDHGMFRLTDRLIDVDTPGARGFGEVNETGIAWKPVPSWLKRRKPGSSVVLEVAYAVSPEEKQAVEYYQRARRAAIFRVPFTFGGAEVDRTLPNMLSAGEHCFIFCKGSAVYNHNAEIARKLQEFGVADVKAFVEKPEVKKFLGKARETLLEADASDKDALFPEMLQDKDQLKLLDKVWPQKKMSAKDKKLFVNWLVAYDASTGYENVLRGLRVSGDLAVQDMANPRATAVLVYDTEDKAKDFTNATYTSPGKFYTWGTDGQKPLSKP